MKEIDRCIARRSTRRSRWAFGLATLVSATVAVLPHDAPAESVTCSIAATGFDTASAIRGLKKKHDVPCLVHDREEVKKYLVHAVRTKIPKEQLENDELIGKALGFIPEDFNYADGIVNLYLSQLGGYYDPERKHYVMAGWLPEMMQPTIAVHELTHALQDQYYNLDSFTDDSKLSTDELMARAAVVEGDATAVMLDYQRGLMGQPPIGKTDDVNSFIIQTALSIGVMGGEEVPESLKMMLVFPYASGLRFVHSILRSGGYPAIDKLFETPPASTEEVLHPEKYGRASQEFTRFTDAEIAALGGGTAVYGDTLGEFALSSLLSMFVQDKQRAAIGAAGWAGDRVVVIGGREKERVFMRTRWDTADDAREFFSIFRGGLEHASGTVIVSSTDTRFTAKRGPRDLTMTLDGAGVDILSVRMR